MSHGLNTNPFVPQVVNGKEETLSLYYFLGNTYNALLSQMFMVCIAFQRREDKASGG